MIVESKRSLFIVSSFRSFVEIHSQAQKLLSIAERLQLSHRFDKLAQIVSQLEKLPLTREQELAAEFFKASCLYYNSPALMVIKMFERVMDEAPLRFRAKACLGLGAIKVYSGDLQTGNQFYNEALKLASHIKSFDNIRFYVLKNQASLLGMNGDNLGALRVLKSLMSVASTVRLTDPAGYYDYLNNMAVELMDLRQFEEAERYINQALASPFAGNYPEWRETKRELLESRRGCRHRAQISCSGRNNIAVEALQVDFAKISLPAMYVSTPIDRMSTYRENRTWPANAPDETARLLGLSTYNRDAMKKDNRKRQLSGKSDIKNLSPAQKQTRVIDLYLRLKQDTHDSAIVDTLLNLISVEDKEKRLFEQVLTSGISEESLDRLLGYLTEQDTAKQQG